MKIRQKIKIITLVCIIMMISSIGYADTESNLYEIIFELDEANQILLKDINSAKEYFLNLPKGKSEVYQIKEGIYEIDSDTEIYENNNHIKKIVIMENKSFKWNKKIENPHGEENIEKKDESFDKEVETLENVGYELESESELNSYFIENNEKNTDQVNQFLKNMNELKTKKYQVFINNWSSEVMKKLFMKENTVEEWDNLSKIDRAIYSLLYTRPKSRINGNITKEDFIKGLRFAKSELKQIEGGESVYNDIEEVWLWHWQIWENENIIKNPFDYKMDVLVEEKHFDIENKKNPHGEGKKDIIKEIEKDQKVRTSLETVLIQNKFSIIILFIAVFLFLFIKIRKRMEEKENEEIEKFNQK